MKRMLRKRTLILAVLCGAMTWVLWPIYGFLSNQYETARLPWAWTSLPAEAPVGTSHVKLAYASVDKFATQILETRRLKIQAPSLSAAVSVNGELVWANAVGWQDVANEKPASTETIYRIGSASKAVVATGLARLVSNGTMELNAPISSYSDDLPNADWNNFTPRQLISHTAGLAAYEENNDWVGFYHSLALRRHFNDPKPALSVFDGADTLYESGTQFHYSGFDNVLLSAVMQDAADESFNSLMSSLVFDPNKLTTIEADGSEAAMSNMAVSYQIRKSKAMESCEP